MPNRLEKEKSPYLLQHANNPVDWYPWGDEAFAAAAREDKPIFLSVGYSTCHWCHVMERESFEDEDIARLMNETFICIKVDREERPDIDSIYMTVCSMMTGGGGWPLTIIMTPDRKPFFAGTYFAKHTTHGRIGMIDMIPRLNEIWQNRRSEVLQSTENIIEVLQKQNSTNPGAELNHEILHAAFNDLVNRYDPVHSGFSRAPKFPTPQNILFLLRYWKMTGKEQALSMAADTLKAMRFGGIYDHVGFGFHRYATDEKWLLPHFEKMLYDQALLAVAYLECYQVTAESIFKQTAQEIFTYVLRDMYAPEGGFYSAEDADSEGIEGKFYTWTLQEIQENLPPEQFDLVRRAYNLKPEGNFQDEATHEKTGTNIFHRAWPPSGNSHDSPEKSFFFNEEHEQIRERLFSLRERRIHPHKDDKILVDWNGLMIGALAMGARILDRPDYLERANRAAQFLLTSMRSKDNSKIMHRFREGEAAINGLLCDYAFIVWGLLELYQAGLEPEILKEAASINELMLKLFWDSGSGGFFLTPSDGETLIIRPKEVYDGALPSGNSIALSNLLRLERLTANRDLGVKARELVQAFSDTLNEAPAGYTQFLAGLYSVMTPGTEIVLVGDPRSEDTREMLSIMRTTFLPGVVMLFKDPTSDNKILEEISPFTADYKSISGKATAYVCRNFSCEAPVTDPRQFLKLLQK